MIAGILVSITCVAASDAPPDDPLRLNEGEEAPALRFRRHHALGKTGVGLLVSGLGGIAVGGALASDCYPGQTYQLSVFFPSETSDADTTPYDALCVVGTTLFVAGAITSATGEVLLFDGAIASNRDLRSSDALGWIGVGLAVASVPVTAVVPPAGVAMHVGGLVAGAVHLGRAGREGRQRQLVLAPTGRGIAVAGTF